MRTSPKLYFAAGLVGLLIVLLGAELISRAYVWWHRSDPVYSVYTEHASVKGRYTNHLNLPYVLSSTYAEHNRLGFRGREITTRKPQGVRRLVALGASTTYGIYVCPDQTYAAQLERLLKADPADSAVWGVINAGVPGWVSSETMLNFALRILPLNPDVIFVYQGLNELFPQSYRGFEEDYSHYRRADYSFSTTNYAQKELFRRSYFAMLLNRLNGERWFGWSRREEHPLPIKRSPA